MLTEFGKVMRIIRINTGDSMRDMAAKIGMSATYLSAIETGKRNIPANMEELLFSHYNFSEKDKKKKLIYKLSKGDIDEETLDRLCEIISEQDKEGK